MTAIALSSIHSRVRELAPGFIVSLIVAAASSFLSDLQWVPGTSVPHLPDQEPQVPGHRYYGPRRLPIASLGVVRYALSFPDTLERSSCFVSLAHARFA